MRRSPRYLAPMKAGVGRHFHFMLAQTKPKSGSWKHVDESSGPIFFLYKNGRSAARSHPGSACLAGLAWVPFISPPIRDNAAVIHLTVLMFALPTCNKRCSGLRSAPTNDDLEVQVLTISYCHTVMSASRSKGIHPPLLWISSTNTRCRRHHHSHRCRSDGTFGQEIDWYCVLPRG